MTTTITKIVGAETGDDYTTIQAAIDAVPTDLVSADEAHVIQVRKDAYREYVHIPAMTSDATRYLTLTCVPGDEHKMAISGGVSVRPFYDSQPSDYGVITIEDEFAVVENLEVSESLSGSSSNHDIVVWKDTAAGGDNRAKNILVHDAVGAYPFRGNNRSTGVTFENCVALRYTDQPASGVGSDSTFVNCTFVRSFEFIATSWDGIESAKAINCLCINHGGITNHADFFNLAAGSSNNLSADTSGDVQVTDLATLFRTFTDAVTDTGMDLHLKSGAAAIGAGVGPGSDSSVPTKDIDGDTRSGATTDIGADLYVASAAPTFTGTIPDQSATEGYPVTDSFASYFGNANSFTIDNLPDGMGFSPTTCTLSGAPSSDAVGVSVTSTITATNDTGSVDSNAFTWTIAANQTPTIANQLADQTSDAATNISVDLSGSITDADGGDITYSCPDASLPPSLSVVDDAITGTLTADSDTDSPYSVTIRGTDPGGAFVDMTLTWTVNAQAVNSPPTFDGPIPDQVWGEGNSVSLDVSGYFADSDGTIVGYSATGGPDNTDIDDNGLLSGTIASGAAVNSPYSIVVTATDNSGKSTAADAFSATVTAAAAKQFTVKLSSPTGGAVLGTPSQAIVTII